MPTTFLSPGIDVSEFQYLTSAPQVTTSIAAVAGVYRWGPIGEPVLVSDEKDYAARFLGPSNLNYETWFSGRNFSAYASGFYVSRAGDTSSANGQVSVLSATGLYDSETPLTANQAILSTVKSDADFTFKQDTGFPTNVGFIGRFPGAAGNSLRVAAVYTQNDYASTINLASIGSGATFSANVGSNTASFLISGAANSENANTLGQALKAEFTVGDLILLGNTTIGEQYVQVTGISVSNTTNTTATVSVNLAQQVSIHTNFSSNTTVSRFWEFYRQTGRDLGTSSYVYGKTGNNAINDEMHIVVVDDGGVFSGVPGLVLEKWVSVSRATDAKALNGDNNYFGAVINQGSQYIRFASDNPNAASANSGAVAPASTTAPLSIRLSGGADGADESNIPMGAVFSAYDLFNDSEKIQVDIVIAGKARGGVNQTQLGNYLIDNIAGVRKDCLVVTSPGKDAVVNNKGNERRDVKAFGQAQSISSYRITDTGYGYQLDRYNNVYRWVPLNGHVAGLLARTERTNDVWWSPAGTTRGQLKDIVQLAYNPGKVDRDALYPYAINPIVRIEDEGTYLNGDKTGVIEASPFGEIGIRRLFIYLEKVISRMAKSYMFEFNDAFTQARFRNAINPLLSTVQGRRGLIEYYVQCDSSNNTADVVAQQIFVGSIFVRPNHSINYIKLNFTAVDGAVTFGQLIGAF